MDWKIVSVGEITEIQEDRGFVRVKKVRFTVNGKPHTIKVSMPDFQAGNTNDIVKAEAEKIIAIYTKK